MNKKIWVYGLVWGVALALFHLVAFLIPGDGRAFAPFWVAYGFTLVAFGGQLFFAWRVLQADTDEDLFYGISGLYAGFIGPVVLSVVCIFTALFPQISLWITILVCIAVLAISVLRVLMASAAAGMVKERGESVRRSTQSIRRLASEAEHLMSIAKTPEMRTITKKVYESVQFSDTVTHPSLVSQNEQIHTQFAAFRDAVESGDAELASAVAEELLSLLDARKKQAMLIK